MMVSGCLQWREEVSVLQHVQGRWQRKSLPETYERYTVACVCQADRWGGQSAMVWAATSVDHCSDLVFTCGNRNAVHYRDEILGPVVLPFMEWVGGRAVFQHDNTRPYVARVCTHFLMKNDVHVLPCPAVSLDLNPIFHMIRSDVTAGSMRWQITALLDANGGHVNYWTLKLKCVIFVNLGCITVWFWFSLNKLARCSTHLLLWCIADVRIQ